MTIEVRIEPAAVGTPPVDVSTLRHGQNVLRRHFLLNHVHGRDDVAATRCEILDPAPHFLLHLIRRTKGQNMLRINGAPEADIVAERALQGTRVHISS